MRCVTTVLVLLALSASALAQERRARPRPDTPRQSAEKVLAAFQAKDEAALEALAEKGLPDHWLVADELCFRGEHDAALAFAEAALGPDSERLPGYVVSQRGVEGNRAGREVLEKATQACRARDLEAALAILEQMPESPVGLVSVRLLELRGYVLRALRRLDASADAFHRAAEIALDLGWLRAGTRGLHESGMSAWHGSDYRTALAVWEMRLALDEERQDRVSVAGTLGNIGMIYRSLGDFPKALEFQERALKLKEELGDRAGAATTLGNIGNIHKALGDYRKALEFQGQAVKLMEEFGDRAGVARTLGNIGNIHKCTGDFPNALDFQTRALQLNEELGDCSGVATVLLSIGVIYYCLGDQPKALENLERALKLLEALGDRAGVATTLGNIGVIHKSLGDYPRALDFQKRSLKLKEDLGDRDGVAKTLGNIGMIHFLLGDDAKALNFQERTLKLEEDLGDRAGVARTLGNIGVIHRSLGDYAKALDFQKRALELHKELGERAGVAKALGNIGSCHKSLGDYAKAQDFQKRSLRLKEELGDRVGVAKSLVSLGVIRECFGDHEEALEFLKSALSIAQEIGASDCVLYALGNLAMIHLALGDPVKALEVARSAVRELGGLSGGLAEQQGAGLRERFGDVFEIGLLAGEQLDDPVEVSFFLESGRAGSLLEFLGGREKLQAFLVPEALRTELSRARGAESVAAHLLTRAQDGGNRKKIGKCRSDLESARERVQEVVQRVQREAKAAADVLYHVAASLEDISSRTEDGEALVLYALTQTSALALVVTEGKGRIVSLGETAKLRKAVEAVVLTDPARDPSVAIEALRKRVLEPLELPEGTSRLLISPHGALSLVPFALLFPGEVAYVPSGTTYGVLLDEKANEGEGVLALGDPDYGVKVNAEAVAALYRGGKLSQLPATKEEAKSVGDVLLLGKDATEAGFSTTLSKRPRWRAVHLACHGLIDMERPTLSSLAFTPDPENDGFLTCLEVFRMKIPADLVVLSACETARGKVYRAEGIMGLTRAFMMAGAPRVLCSLWNVDDEATMALMVRFYELWIPMEGEGLSAATALKQAQEFVRSHEKWQHPYYWAAWVLWGLPD